MYCPFLSMSTSPIAQCPSSLLVVKKALWEIGTHILIWQDDSRPAQPNRLLVRKQKKQEEDQNELLMWACARGLLPDVRRGEKLCLHFICFSAVCMCIFCVLMLCALVPVCACFVYICVEADVYLCVVASDQWRSICSM